MAALPRLNGLIRALENGEVPISVFTPPTIDSAVNLSIAPYDGIIFESEHNPYDVGGLRDCLQYLLNRRQILERIGDQGAHGRAQLVACHNPESSEDGRGTVGAAAENEHTVQITCLERGRQGLAGDGCRL